MKKAILFDFDGTLADSSEGIMECALETVGAIGYDTSLYTTDYLRRFIGPPLSDCFRITFSVPEEKIGWCVDRYRVLYSSKGMYMMHLYNGIPQLLEALRRNGYKTAVATNKMKNLAEECCRNLGIYDLFDYISGPGKDGGCTWKLWEWRGVKPLWSVTLSMTKWGQRGQELISSLSPGASASIGRTRGIDLGQRAPVI